MTPEVGLELVNPVAQTVIRFVATAATTDGRYVEVEATYPPGSPPPPRHLHPEQDETFTLLAGTLAGSTGDEEFEAKAGDSFRVPRGTPHRMGAGADGATFRWRTEPPMRTGEMFCAMWQVAHDNEWTPDVGQLLTVVGEFGAEFRLA